MQPFTEKTIQIIKEIPPGKVMSYGQIAVQAGSPRGARQVARILHSLSEKHELPWHRVVNAEGKIMLRDEEARHAQTVFLQTEGVEVDQSGKVDLKRFRHDPN
ncbi:MGMT family protein [Planococcus salinus]|uniref:MGMT family protein n=1 Tax=Planococcus salinus TaxID=1848460 RepID=A0A3M8P4T7_9BACL|nr:MGMT family protein [Planococcus salinus]RNF38411.1 MGMT family protein [Planococcus salinus]